LPKTYVAEVLLCCNISRCKKRVNADAVPACVAVPTCTRISKHEVDINRHEAYNCMRKRTSMQGWVCGHNSCLRDVQTQSYMQAAVACGAGGACFFGKKKGRASAVDRIGAVGWTQAFGCVLTPDVQTLVILFFLAQLSWTLQHEILHLHAGI
jgi:hypothetical protein